MEGIDETSSTMHRVNSNDLEKCILQIKDDFVLKELAGTFLIIPLGENAIRYRQIMSLNKTGAWIWGQLVDGITQEALAERMKEQYGITIEEARDDLKIYLEHLDGIGVLKNEEI